MALGSFAIPKDLSGVAISNGAAAVAGWAQRGIWDMNESQGLLASSALALLNLVTPFASGVEGQVLTGAGLSGASTLGWVGREKYTLPGLSAHKAISRSNAGRRVPQPAGRIPAPAGNGTPRPQAAVVHRTPSGKDIIMTES